MRKFDLEEAAQIAIREGLPIRILDNFMSTGLISVKMVSLEISQNVCESVEKIANQYWEKIYTDGLFNGVICAARSLWTSDESLAIEIVEIDYKTFRATDHIIEGIEGYFPPLAIGVHALLLGSQSILALKLADGTLGTPGGAVDVEDLEGEQAPFINALLREINEEAGIKIEHDAIRPCGVYIVHDPLHLVFLYVALLDDDLVLSADFSRAVKEEEIVGIQSIDRSEIYSLPNSIHDALGLCISSANRLGYL